MADTTGAATSPPPALHALVRSATSEVHERLHSHPGLAAVKAGTISRAAYRALLTRLYGFHRPFETATAAPPERTRWLEADLAVFGLDHRMCLALPQCRAFPPRPSPGYRLGAHYVVEGSALGGRGLARQLDGLLGADTTAGRRFFTGHGPTTGIVWRDYLTRLAAAPAEDHAGVTAGATETFAVFEQWLDGWDAAHD